MPIGQKLGTRSDRADLSPGYGHWMCPGRPIWTRRPLVRWSSDMTPTIAASLDEYVAGRAHFAVDPVPTQLDA